MNFLVTGGAGFIGSHVCERLLLAGHAVWAFDDLNNFYDPQIKRRNLRDIQSLAKPFEFVDQPERGVTYWDWTLRPVRRDDGWVEGLVFSLVDVTERVALRALLPPRGRRPPTA